MQISENNQKKNKIKTLTDYWAGSPTRGPLTHAARLTDAAHLARMARGVLPPTRALATGPRMSGTQW
jgi:hypothetical protein